MAEPGSRTSFWTSLPGVLTGVAAVITAMATLTGALVAAGAFEGGGSAPPATGGESRVESSGTGDVPSRPAQTSPAMSEPIVAGEGGFDPDRLEAYSEMQVSGSYPADFVDDFITGCTFSGSERAYCECFIDGAQQEIDFEDFVNAVLELIEFGYVFDPDVAATLEEIGYVCILQ